MGIFGITSGDCEDMPLFLLTLGCDLLRLVSSIFSFSFLSPFTPLVTPFFSADSYWHDPSNELFYSLTWLAGVNSNKYGKYLSNYNLSHAIFIEFLQDELIFPHESESFGFYKDSTRKSIVPMREQKVYLEDTFGLKQLDNQGKLIFLQSNSQHVILSDDFIKMNLTKYIY